MRSQRMLAYQKERYGAGCPAATFRFQKPDRLQPYFSEQVLEPNKKKDNKITKKESTVMQNQKTKAIVTCS